MNYYIGVDIGGTKIAYGLFDEKKQLIMKKVLPSDDKLVGEAFFYPIAQEIRLYQQEAENLGGKLRGVGIGITGFVDFENGAITVSCSLPGTNHFPVAQYLQSQLGDDIRVVMDNDGHCGALAEYRQGAGRGHRHMVYCPVSTGISSAIIIDGQVFRGSNGAAGESGHAIADPPKDLRIDCDCGNSGCYNSMGTGKSIVVHVKRWLEQGETSIIPELAGGVENITAKHISEAYDLGDTLAIRALDQMVHYLTIWIFNVYMLLNIDCFVFAGGLLAMGDKLIGRVIREFETYHTNGFPVEFYTSQLGSDSGLIGAMELLF